MLHRNVINEASDSAASHLQPRPKAPGLAGGPLSKDDTGSSCCVEDGVEGGVKGREPPEGQESLGFR